jgi:predicted enzyme related to lactoylglutathione lyase
MTAPLNPVGWFQIPVNDMERAMAFYDAVFGYTLERKTMPDGDMAWFPSSMDAAGCSGCLVKHAMSHPSDKGTLVHFESPSGDLSTELSRVEKAGGTVLGPKIPIGEYGFYAFVKDTEGNQIGVHSMR